MWVFACMCVCVFACMCVCVFLPACVCITMCACGCQERAPDTLELESWFVNHHVGAGKSNPKSPVRAANACITVQVSLHPFSLPSPPFPSHPFPLFYRYRFICALCTLFLSLSYEEVHLPPHPHRLSVRLCGRRVTFHVRDFHFFLDTLRASWLWNDTVVCVCAHIAVYEKFVFSFLWDTYPGMELLSHRVILRLT